MADNTITVSAVDRTRVVVVNNNNTNHKTQPPQSVDRELCLQALASSGRGGSDFDTTDNTATLNHGSSYSDWNFFYNVEIRNSGALLSIAAVTTFFFGLFLASFWGSDIQSAAYILIAGDIIAFFSVNPYLLTLVDWRIAMSEEAEALLHSSKSLNKLLKTILCTTMIMVIALVEYGMVNAVVDGLESPKYFWAMFFDTGSTTLPFVCYGLYTNLPAQAVESLSLLPFLFLIFFSTTFSPGAGLPVLKELRYLVSRFYFWCMVPGVQDEMEGCPADPSINMMLLCVTGLMTVILFFVYYAIMPRLMRSFQHAKAQKQKKDILKEDPEFQALQKMLRG